MTVHLLKLCVGAGSLSDLEDWVRYRVAENLASGQGGVHDHVTRMFPKRAHEILDGGSLYWVIRGQIQARQRVVGLDTVTGADGVQRCAILLGRKVVATYPQPRRAFQGWRYLGPGEAPADLAGEGRTDRRGDTALLEVELLKLGLL